MAVKIIPPRTYSAAEMYNFYQKIEPKSKVPYWMFKEVIARFNKKASDAIIMGGMLNLGSNLGFIRIKKIKRNYEKFMPNWGASNKLKEQLIAEGKSIKGPTNPDGEPWIVYFTDAWYLRWNWVKKGVCRVKNQSVYEFKPTSNRSKTAGEQDKSKLGNKGRLVLANKLNPALHHVYEY